MKILAISDIHGFHAVYRAIPDLAQTNGAELIVFAGDLLGYPDGYPNVQEASARVRPPWLMRGVHLC